MIKNKRGFTLIELLVVMSIISLLSSIVFASLNTARTKARDAAVKQISQQMVRMMALNYSDYGSYSQLQNMAWMYSVADCNAAAFSGTYATKMREMCVNYMNVAAGYTPQLHMGVDPAFSGTTNSNFSILMYMPNTSNVWQCVGSSGSIYLGPEPDTGGTWWQKPGCYSNP